MRFLTAIAERPVLELSLICITLKNGPAYLCMCMHDMAILFHVVSKQSI